MSPVLRAPYVQTFNRGGQMSTEVFSAIVHIPSARRSTVNERQTMTSLEVERITYDLKKAMDSYDESAVLTAIKDELTALEERFDIKFHGFRVTLANNRTHTHEKSDVSCSDGAAVH